MVEILTASHKHLGGILCNCSIVLLTLGHNLPRQERLKYLVD